jgi:asparagine synthase (glutamine-hydrolysing)
MAFLIGAFGPLCKSLNPNHLRSLAQNNDNDVYSLTVDHAVVFAGYASDDPQLDKIIKLPDEQGLLVGKIFSKENYKPATFTHEISQALITNPALLLKQFWGRYAGVLYDKHVKSITLIRDPLGLSSIFYVLTSDSILFSTELSLLYDMVEEKPSIDWNYFAEYIINQNQALPTTPFKEVRELLPGMELSFTLGGKVSYRHLWDITQSTVTTINDKYAFEEELLAILKACTRAWADESTGVCVELSGGVDSSSIMILLQDILPDGKKLIGVNYIDSKMSGSNEIEHAQEIADLCKIPLSFLDWQDFSLLDSLPSSWRPNRPSSLFLFYSKNQQLKELASSQGCNIIMNGQGGDHVFLAPPPLNSLADLWLTQGLKNFSDTLSQLSALYRMPLIPLISHNLKSVAHYYRGISASTPDDLCYLDPSLAKTIVKHDFYLKDTLHFFYPAKAAQIEGLYHAISYAERDQAIQFQTYVHPLLSQPLVELALRIPTYQSFDNGYDRIFLRKTVSHIKNAKALWRTIKGQTTGSTAKQFALHAHKIQDIVAEGSLAKSGIINIEWFNRELIKINHGLCDNLWPVSHIFVSQLWLNQWQQ